MSENDPIREFQSQMTHLADRAEGLRPVLKSCQEAMARVDYPTDHVGCSFAVGLFGGRPKVHIMVVGNMPIADMVTPALRELAKEGLRNKAKEYEDRKILERLATRSYCLGDDALLTIMPVGSSCRMVQVGEEVVPKYEMRCD